MIDDLTAIEVNGLNVSVGNKIILNDLSLTVNAGELVLVAGPSGSGKSTLLKVIAGIIPNLYNSYDVRGDVLVYGLKPINAVKVGIISYIPQDPWNFFIGINVCDELRLSNLPINTFMNLCSRSVDSLSDGELYELLAYIALNSGSKLLLLDEPTSHLDNHAFINLLMTLKRMCIEYGATVVLVDHRIELLNKYVDKVITLGRYSYIKSNVIRASRPPSSKYAVMVKALTFKYRDMKIINNLDLKVRKGWASCVLGRNGVGKSTLLKLLAGILKPSHGYIYVDGPTFYIPQKPIYWFHSGSVLKELQIYSRVRNDQSKLDDVIRRFNLRDLIDRDPHTLSVGEARRLSMALAYLSSANVILFDEPTIGLDRPSIDVLMDLVEELKLEDRTIIMASHDNRLSEICDDVVELQSNQGLGLVNVC